MSQVITLRLAIHSGIALTGPGAELFIAARPRSETHSQTHTHTHATQREDAPACFNQQTRRLTVEAGAGKNIVI